MKTRGSLLWLKVAFIVIGIPVAVASVNIETSINNWRNIDVSVGGYKTEVSYGDPFHVYVTLKNIGSSPTSVQLDTQCQVGYRLRNNNKQIIREASYENKTCFRFDYNDLKLVPNELEQVDFYVDGLDSGYYRMEVLVKPKAPIILDFKVLEPVNKISQIGEECGGFARFVCAEGLSCNYDGVLPGMPGMCVSPEFDRNNFEVRKNLDYIMWDRKPTNNLYASNLKNSVYDFGFTNFQTGYIRNHEFAKFINEQTGRKVQLVGGEYDFLTREIAATVIYRTYIRNNKPESLKVNFFTDSKFSKYGIYIEEMARLNIVNVPEFRLFMPDGYMSWEVLMEWVGKL